MLCDDFPAMNSEERTAGREIEGQEGKIEGKNGRKEREVVQMGRRSCGHAAFCSMFPNDHQNPHERLIRITISLFHRSHLAMDD